MVHAKMEESKKTWVDNRPLASLFHRLRFPIAAAPPL